MNILIQYEGFTVARAARVYSFLVTDAPGVSRQFTVGVSSESFRISALKFQDGPSISLQRLKQELHKEKEAERAQAEAHLSIGEQDIQKYLERHYPRKRS